MNRIRRSDRYRVSTHLSFWFAWLDGVNSGGLWVDNASIPVPSGLYDDGRRGQPCGLLHAPAARRTCTRILRRGLSPRGFVVRFQPAPNADAGSHFRTAFLT